MTAPGVLLSRLLTSLSFIGKQAPGTASLLYVREPRQPLTLSQAEESHFWL